MSLHQMRPRNAVVRKLFRYHRTCVIIIEVPMSNQTKKSPIIAVISVLLEWCVVNATSLLAHLEKIAETAVFSSIRMLEFTLILIRAK